MMGGGAMDGGMGAGGVDVNDISDTVPLQQQQLISDSPFNNRNPFARPMPSSGLHSSSNPPRRARQNQNLGMNAEDEEIARAMEQFA